MDKTDCPLDKLAEGNNFTTDKSKFGHNFNKLYHRYFQELRDDPINVLEIGLSSGQSIQMWSKYFTNGRFVCMDHDIKHYAYPPNDRITIVKGDQRDTQLLQELNSKYGPFDIIIDDGSHIDSYTKITFDTLFPLLRDGGIYVVEDLHTSYLKEVHTINNTPEFINYTKELVDYVNSHGYCFSGDLHGCIKRDASGCCEHDKMTKMDKLIEFIHFYKSIVFIKKY
jgi:cephalosporin hydroxylase